MTANVVHPAELERVLQARVVAAHSKRVMGHRSHASRGARRVRRSSLALVVGSMLALSAAAAWASHGSEFIDLTANAAQEEHNGAIFTQGGLGAGTGNFDPYLTLSPGGSSDTESGYNVCSEPVFGFDNSEIDCPSPEFDELTGGDRTHELLVSSIPVIEVDSTLYREFHLDSNDSGADPWMAITLIELYLETDPDLTFAQFTASGDLIWELDGDGQQTILLNTQSLESGSGVSDISILIPNDLFPADCFYGSTDCETFLYWYTEAGDPSLDTGDDRNWNTTAGFEEWRIELLPVVNVQKTVDIAFDRTYPWDVAKEANVESIDLFAGDTAQIDWTVTASVGTPVDSNATISGDIDITNPTGPGFAISDSIDAVIVDVEDVLTLGGVDADATVTCPEAFPFDLDAGDTVTCTYTHAPTSTDDGTNTATVTIETNDDGSETAEYTATEDVLFSAADVTEIDECVEVTDDNATPGDTGDDLLLDAELCEDESPGVYNFSTDVGPFDVADCGEVTITNTAFTLTNDTATQDEASDSVTVTCHELSVTKDADPTFSREYDWTITKTVDPETLDLFNGDSDDVTWTVTWDRDDGTDLGHAVTGTITINNPAPIAADDVSVIDSLTGGINATVDCGGGLTTIDVPATSSAECTYSASLPDDTTRTNTATATLFGEDYSGTASVDFTGVDPTEIDATATIADDRGPLDQLESGDGSTTYDETFTCPEDEGDHINTAVVTETDSGETDDDDATVTVNCYELTVTKDAATTYSRDYDWNIAKTRFIADGETDGDGNPLTLTLDEGQTFTASYEITVTMTGFTDADHAVSGTITIDNPAPMDAVDVVVTDVISHAVDADILATVDCDGDATVTVPAEGSVECSYSADLPNADDRLNTATATLFGIGYSGTADVTFDLDNPTTEIDECIDIVDDAGTPGDTSDDLDLGTVCVGDLDENNQWTDEYTLDIGPFAVCGEFLFTNTVSFVTTDDDNDTDESGSATYTVTVTVPCPEGCTLTQGYWKTHNDSFWGGAPTDETWDLLGDVDGDGTSEGELETFFGNAGLTYFDAMWTAPQGNAYFQLSRQYIAAVLNQLDGAAVPANVQAAIDAAEDLFMEYTPAEVAAAKGKGGKELRAQFTSLAGLLASYNEGLIGPGHCDEDPESEPASASSTQFVADRRTSVTIG